MPRQLWIVSELFYPDETSTGYILTCIAQKLIKEGYKVNVLCAKSVSSTPGRQFARKEMWNGMMISRCYGTTFSKDKLLHRLINQATITLALFVNTLACLRKRDVVLFVTNPPVLPILCLVACMIRKSHSILLIHDVYPEVLVAVGMISRDHLLVRLWTSINKLLYNGCTRIVTIGRDMQSLILEKVSSHRGKIMFIPNWADTESISPKPKADIPLTTELCLQGKFVVGYAGNMGYPHDIASIISAAQLLSRCDTIHFLFVGSGAKRKWLELELAKRELHNVTLLPSQPRDNQTSFLNVCDVLIVSLVAGMRGVSVPSRVYNIMAAGKPTIAVVDCQSEIALLLEEKGIGCVVPPDSPEMLAETIQMLHNTPQLVDEMGHRARLAATSTYSRDQIIEQYSIMVKSIPD
jgi:colanic acid biosynthesis glycosyl transferase WcaI